MNKAFRSRLCALCSALCFLALASPAQSGSQAGNGQEGNPGYRGGGLGQNRGAPSDGSSPFGGFGRGRGGRGRGRSSDDDLPPPTSRASSAPAQDVKPMAGEQFYIIASVDQTKQELLLKKPTEVTTLLKASDKTQCFDDTGHPLRLTDFRAGDTVWVASSKEGTDEPTAVRIRKGQMTVAELHKLYLDYAEIK